MFRNPIIDFINQEISAERERSITLDFCNCVCAINRQNYDPCQYGTPSLNISRGVDHNIISPYLIVNSEVHLYTPTTTDAAELFPTIFKNALEKWRVQRRGREAKL